MHSLDIYIILLLLAAYIVFKIGVVDYLRNNPRITETQEVGMWYRLNGKTVVLKECPKHEGAFDCTPFCRICEGQQEYFSNGYLPCENFGTCGEYVDEDIWKEELEMCLDCSNKYWSHDDE